MPKSETQQLTPEQTNYLQQLMCENHELRQVSLEVLSCITRPDLTEPLKTHCANELNRVLFQPKVFLH